MGYRMHLHICTDLFQHDHYETGSMWIWHVIAQISTIKTETQIHHVLPHDFSPIYIAFEILILSFGWPLYLDPCFSGQIPWKTSCWMSWASRNSPWWLPGITWRPSWMMMRPPHDDSSCFLPKHLHKFNSTTNWSGPRIKSSSPLVSFPHFASQSLDLSQVSLRASAGALDGA